MKQLIIVTLPKRIVKVYTRKNENIGGVNRIAIVSAFIEIAKKH
jgi:hypothetical protein